MTRKPTEDMVTDLDGWDDGETVEAYATPACDRFVIESDPERPWRLIVRDKQAEVETKSFASRRDANREAKRLATLFLVPIIPEKSSPGRV